MRQILYVSTSNAPGDIGQLDAILEQSRRYNALDGVTGLLWSDGERFVQAIEGDERAVGETMARIDRDPRHRDIVVLHDRSIDARDFGDWSMAIYGHDDAFDGHDERVRRALAGASAEVRQAFTRLMPAGL